MSGKQLDDLGELQRDVIELVWKLGEATVRQVRDELRRKKHLAYTTVLTAMQNLEKSGWLKHRSEGKTYVYMPTATREEAGGRSLKKFMDSIYDGNALLMFQHLMQQSNLNDSDLKELRKMIDDKRKGGT
jgi:predicted transcriptional regulator